MSFSIGAIANGLAGASDKIQAQNRYNDEIKRREEQERLELIRRLESVKLQARQQQQAVSSARQQQGCDCKPVCSKHRSETDCQPDFYPASS